MNRSILIVIADFLLLSLLAFSSFDVNRLLEEQPVKKTNLVESAGVVDVNQDLVNVLKEALEDERRSRQQLAGELNLTKEVVRGQQNMTAEQERQNQAIQQALQQKELQTRQLEQTRLALQQQIAAAQTNLQGLQQQLKSTATSALVAKEKLATMHDELRREQENSNVAQQQLSELEEARRQAEAEKHQLAQRLQVLEAERRVTSEQLAVMQGEVEEARKEKAKILQHADKLADGVNSLAQSSDRLAEGVSTLAQKSDRLSQNVTTLSQTSEQISGQVNTLAKTSDKISGQVTSLAKSSENLTQEIREHRPLTPNAIFNDFLTNQVHAQFEAVRSGIFGAERTRRRETEMILASDGTNTFAICHVEDTPFTFWNPGTDWEKMTGTLSRSSAQFPIDRLSFYLLDPRVIMIPISKQQASRMNCKVYPLATDRFRFQDAVLVGAKEGYYGESKFQIDLATPQYVKFDRNLFRGLFGRFNPSRGDLVFTRTGELLGIMANSTYCIVIHNFTPAVTFALGETAPPQNTGRDLEMFFQQVMQLPQRLH